jgi:hypothetical protein
MTERRRFKQTIVLKDRLTTLARKARAKAAKLGPGQERDGALLKAKARRPDATSHLSEWINSPGLRPPR